MNAHRYRSIARFHGRSSSDLFEKCTAFRDYTEGIHRWLETQYRVPLLSALDARVIVRKPDGGAHEMICYDSNSYLGLHLHPRVIAAVRDAIDRCGYGTASAQVMGGTNSWLLELEQEIAALHGRQAALIFPSGYQANVGILTGLLRPGDRVYIDQFAHASLHDGARYAGAEVSVYPHRDAERLEALLQADKRRGARLIVSDGLFSMHGDLAPLPALLDLGKRYGARVMIDEAHSLGVIGPGGRGLEKLFGHEGEIDLCMGTFSKAAGIQGGYLCADPEVVEYLRYFARGGLFTAAPPAAQCAGLTESLRIMVDEPEHRERLWDNCRYLWAGFDAIGLQTRPLESPILPVRVGDEHLLAELGPELFAAGIKCGCAQYPAVPAGEATLRFTVCARHRRDDLDRTIEVMDGLAAKWPIRREDKEALAS